MAISVVDEVTRREARDLFEQALDLMRMPSAAYTALSNDASLRLALITILLADDEGTVKFDLPVELIQKRLTTIIALMVVATEG